MKQINDIKKLAILVVFVFIQFFAITCLDYVVHNELYKYGLVFSYRWAVPYWISFGVFYTASAFTVSAAYMISRRESLRHKATAALLGVTVLWQQISGNIDGLWFLIGYALGKPHLSWNQVWWWSPFYHLGIQWTTLHQVLYIIVMNTILLTLWYVWWQLYRRSPSIERAQR